MSRGGTALDAVETAIAVLEDDPVFDAGTGSHLNLDGRAELDAIVMDGRTLKAGAVAAVSRIRNPIRLARRILESSPHMMFVANGAEQFAVEQGMELCNPEDLITEHARAALQRCRADLVTTQLAGKTGPGSSGGTVGAVAFDGAGNLVAGTSTGGTCGKHAGRVGDSPLIGCGCYADLEAGGVSCTGRGEAIMKIVMAKTAVDFLRNDFAENNSGSRENSKSTHADALTNSMAAARRAVHLLATRVQGTGGLILLDRHGRPGFAFNTPRMAFGYVSEDGSFVIGI